MADEVRTIRIVIDSSAAVGGSRDATRAMEKLERSMSSIDASASRMEAALGRVGGYMKAHLALIAADMGARLLQMGRDSLKAAGDLDDLAEQLGVTTTGLQALQFAAVQGGMKLEQLESGVGKFSQKLGEAAGGSREMIEALNNIGVRILDVNGKLRPTETLMTEVARAITSMEDPAKRSAAAVDFFGKAGTRMLPMLKDIAGGFEDMAEKAKRGGAMISKEAIEKLKELGDASERSQLKMRALFAENAAGPLTDALDFITRKLENLSAVIKSVSLDFNTLLKLTQIVTSPGALVGQLLGASPAEKLKKDLETARGEAAAAWDNLGKATTDRDRARMMSAYSRAQERVAGYERTQNVMDVGGRADYRPSDPDGVGILLANKPGGARNPTPTGAGQGEADRIAKLGRDTGRDLDAAKAYAEASERGARAVADLELHFKALKAAQDAYGATADKNAGQVAALTAKLEEQMKAAERLKSLKDFNLGTEELEKTNELLAAENGLINANAEDRARELALIKTKQEVQARGLDESNAAEKVAIDRRHAAIEQNERLKAQGEELRKANELWTAPLKSALESIQATAADAFAGMLESGKFSFQALGDVVKKTVIRMIAEFAALAVVRPMMGAMMSGLQGIGLVSPSTASSLGYGRASGGGASGGGFSMPSLGGGSGMFGFLNQPITAGGGSMPPGMYGPPAPTAGALGGLTWGGALAGAAGIGMGAYQMATSKNAAGAIGGGLGILGSGIGMASAAGWLPMLGAAGGPIGMGLAMAGMFLPMLFGGEEAPPLPPLAGSNLRFDPGAGGYTMADTQQNGGASMAGQYGGVNGTLNALFNRAGGITDPSRAFSAAIWNNQREGTTSTYEISPVLGSNQMSEGSGDQSAAIDRMIARVFYQSIRHGAAGGASPTLMQAVGNTEPKSVAAVEALLSLVDTYDKLGKVVPSAETALEEIATQFDGLTAGARQYGLALAPIEKEQKKTTERFARDFIDGMLDPLAVQMRALDDQRRDSLASAEYIRDNVQGVYVDMARIAEYWTKRELELKNQAYSASVDSLQALIRRLTYGDLANASATTSLAGTRGTYEAALAQSRAGNDTAFNNLAGYAEAYTGTARSYFASSAEYAAIIAQIRRDLEEQAASRSGGAASAGTAANANAEGNALLRTVAEQSRMVAALTEKMDRQSDQISALTAQLQRRS